MIDEQKEEFAKSIVIGKFVFLYIICIPTFTSFIDFDQTKVLIFNIILKYLNLKFYGKFCRKNLVFHGIVKMSSF